MSLLTVRHQLTGDRGNEKLWESLRLVSTTEDSQVIGKTFELLGVAEEEISRVKKRYPNRAPVIDAFFMDLAPDEIMLPMIEEVYRAHCRELLDRVALDMDTRVATDAELLAHLSVGSLSLPFDLDHAALMGVLCMRVLDPARTQDLIPGVQESYPGAVDELEAKLRSTLIKEWRTHG